MDILDKECVRRCRNGHPEDFEQLVGRYQKPVFSFLAGKLGNPVQAEEAVQESFVRAFISLKKLRKPESFYAWLLGIADRVAKEQFRLRKRAFSESDIETAATIHQSGEPEEYALDEALAVLPEAYRHLIVLRYYEGLSCQEVSRRNGMPLGTVTKMLSRAYAILRKELQARRGKRQDIFQG
jgi:RNA polymerase sigma-70 factor (ECF subfamily)